MVFVFGMIHPKPLLIAVLLATLGTTLGCGTNSPAGGEDPIVPQTANTQAAVIVEGGSPAQKVLLARDANAGGITHITRAILGDVPEGFDRPQAPYAWVYLTVQVSSDEDACRATWEALLVNAAFKAQSEDADLPQVVGHSITAQYMDGTTRNFGAGLNNGLPLDPAGMTGDVTKEALTTTLGARVEAAGLKVSSIDFATVDTVAPLVTAITATPAKTVGHKQEILDAIFGELISPRSPVDGVFFEVLDESEKPVMQSGYVTLLSGGVGWIRPELDHTFDDL